MKVICPNNFLNFTNFANELSDDNFWDIMDNEISMYKLPPNKCEGRYL